MKLLNLKKGNYIWVLYTRLSLGMAQDRAQTSLILPQSRLPLDKKMIGISEEIKKKHTRVRVGSLIY